MATSAEVVSRIDTILKVVAAEVADLPEVAQYWDEESDDNQVTYYLEWDELMDRLESVAKAHRAGQLTPDQEARYQAVVCGLRAALPIIKRLDLSLPNMPLDA